MSITKLNNLSLSAVTALPSGVGGKVLQVVTTTLTTHFSGTSATFADVTGFSVSITPSSASNKILLLCDQKCQASGYAKTRILRGSTAIYVGTAPSSRIPANWGTFSQASPYYTEIMVLGGTSTFLDSPSTTSSTTYKLQYQTGGTFYFNTNGANGDDANHPSMASSITVMEIAG